MAEPQRYPEPVADDGRSGGRDPQGFPPPGQASRSPQQHQAQQQDEAERRRLAEQQPTQQFDAQQHEYEAQRHQLAQQHEYEAQQRQLAQQHEYEAQQRQLIQQRQYEAQQHEYEAQQRQLAQQSGQGATGGSGALARRRAQSQVQSMERARAREARWQNKRLAVPYPTDGPKITFGGLWFLALVGAVVLGEYVDSSAVSSVAVAAVGAPIAALAGLQAGNAWFPSQGATRSWTAAAAYLSGVAGLVGPWGVPIGLLLGVIAIVFYVMLYRGHRRSSVELFDVLARSALPVGLAVASLAALASVGTGVQLSLILLISAYEVGDFTVGSGASNAVEGPLAGIVALGAVAFLLFLVQPAPFDTSSILVFAAITGICCPLGQILASGLLPRGGAWAPALRRLDSYLLAAPLWLVLVPQLPTAS